MAYVEAESTSDATYLPGWAKGNLSARIVTALAVILSNKHFTGSFKNANDQ